jgi:hypothetical protein
MSDRMGPGDFFDLVKAYAKQETLDPLKGAGRWLAFGLAGSVVLILGGISLTLALLRVLQEETGSAFTGNLSWVPPTITLVAVTIVLVMLTLRITKRSL